MLAGAAVLALWQAIQRRLDRELPDWRSLVAHLGQVEAVERREAGHSWSNDEVFEALLRAVLSNHTDWAKIERVLPELHEVFLGFHLDRYAEVDEQRLGGILRDVAAVTLGEPGSPSKLPGLGIPLAAGQPA